MKQTVDDVLRGTELATDGRDYRLLRLPADASALACEIVAETGLPFAGLIIDQDEATLLLRQDVYELFEARLRQARVSDERYRLITFTAALEPDLVGFLARVSEALAAAGVPILAYGAFSRDHILTPVWDYQRAMKALRQLQQEAGRG